ncbi:prepilin peptidase [Streptomyces phyllanthi]|uniref:Prepilin peptidase n=1 Tax=Streptomyces phyllanthi TaxID=1803180 RepID=A0A5N8WCV1_9ACTN|nr:A24 family peptidase [Streptomyces phyllanthi]MPY45300.1 prepilin peptidase [Streptomyces phyllanthi]
MDLDLALTVAAAVWGAAAGVLVPRAAYRLAVEPEESWRDVCPAGHPIRGLARGWLGRARCVEAPYGPSTPVTALVTALVCAALALATGTRPELAVWLLLAPVGVLLTLVDLKVQRLPDVLTLPLAGTALVLLGAAALLPEHAGQWRTALSGALALGGFYFLFFLIRPIALGFGDVKLALGLGAVLGWYGWGALFLGTFAASVFGSVHVAVLVALRRAGRRTPVAMGPYLIAGAFAGVLLEAYAA